MYYIVITKKKQRNVCYNFFESLYSFAHFTCKGYILYSKLLLQWAGEKKNFARVPKLKKLYLEISKYHIEKKYVLIIFEVKRQKKMFRRKKNFDCKSPMKWPYVYILFGSTKVLISCWPFTYVNQMSFFIAFFTSPSAFV